MKHLTAILLFATLASGTAQAQTSTAELVQSFPVETTLQVPGIPLTQNIWLELIQSATSTIDIEQYYINNVTGQALDPIISALKAAGARGVKIRFIIDAAFLAEPGDSTEANCLEGIQNLEIKKIDFTKLGGIMHAKYLVIDHSKIYVGSANFDWLALTQIHEMGMHIVDPTLAADLENTFNLDWNASTATSLPEGSFDRFTKWVQQALAIARTPSPGLPSLVVSVSPTSDRPAGIDDTLTEILTLLATAKNNVNIQVYEYSTEGNARNTTWLTLDNAIRAAAARGVKVQMLLDNVTMKSGGAALQALGKVRNITVRTVIIPQWSGGPLAYARLIHSKYMTVDNTYAWVGSENWIESYFTGTRNAGVVNAYVTLTNELNLVFNQVWTSAYTTTQ